MKKYLIPFSVIVLMASTASAQRYDGYQTNQRVDQIEKTLGAMQQQIAQQNSTIGGQSGRLSADLAQIQEQMRQLSGQIEQLQHQIDQSRQQNELMQRDIEVRFQQLTPVQPPVTIDPTTGQPISTYQPAPVVPGTGIAPMPNTAIVQPGVIPANPPAVTPAIAPAPVASTAAEPPASDPVIPLESMQPAPSDDKLAAELQSIIDQEPSTATVGDLTKKPAAGTATELYNRGFAMLNQTDYAGAESLFTQFTHQYPQDPLAGNAWYWLGETFYVRRNYVKAADSFRQGFEKLPDGPKAGDNLLKLAMSLAALKRDKEACVVLKQVDKKYAKNSSSLNEKARQELNRLGCK